MENTKNKAYRSIRTKLLLSFVIVMIMLLISNIVFIVMHFSFVKQYEDVTNRLMTEGEFSVQIPSLIESYLSTLSGASKSRYDMYYAERSHIMESIESLDSTIVKPESKVLYHSLRNFVTNMVSICDDGLNHSMKNDSAESLRIYQNDIMPMKPYIIESTSNLMISELDYAQNLQNNIRQTQEWIIILSIIFLVVIVNLTILFVIDTSNKITTPLIRLSNIAKDISGGDLNRNIDADLLEFNDEIGSLSNSINGMLKRMNEEIEHHKKNSEKKDHRKE